MSSIESYRAELSRQVDWDAYLLANSGLPGPRGNLELAHAAAELGEAGCFQKWLEFDPEKAPTNSPGEFLAFCGALGLGKLVAEGQLETLQGLRRLANDPRWRMREAVAMALQTWGKVDIDALLQEMEVWSGGSWLEMRAAAAALCEPALLSRPETVLGILDLLDRITTVLAAAPAPVRKSEEYRALRKGLGYCWSVAAAALPFEGKARLEKWLASPDPDVQWVMRENLKKKRIQGMFE